MDIEGRGKSSSYDVGHARASTPLRPQTSEEKAAAATRVADDLRRCAEFVHDDVGALRSAVAARDDAADHEVQHRLASAEEAHPGAQRLVVQAPAAPQPRAPELSCADALLAAHHRIHHRPSGATQTFELPLTNQMTTSDIAAFRAIVTLTTGSEQSAVTRCSSFSTKTRSSCQLAYARRRAVPIPLGTWGRAERAISADRRDAA